MEVTETDMVTGDRLESLISDLDNGSEVGQECVLTIWAFGSIAEAVTELPFLRTLKLLQREIEYLLHHSLFRPGDPIAVVLQTDKPTIN